MGKRRVLILSNESLLMSGVLSILQERPEIEVATVRDAGRDLHRRIREVTPHVVVVDGAAMDKDGGLGIARFLRQYPRTTLVVLRLDRPDIEVFRARRVRQATQEELIGVVDGAQRKARRAVTSRKDAGPGPAS